MFSPYPQPLISQVRCTSCVSTTWPGWNPRRNPGRRWWLGQPWIFAWGPQSINIGLVCKPWTFSSLHNCDEIGFRVCSMRATSSHSRTSCQGHIRDRMSFHEDAWPSGLNPLAVWKVKQFYRNVRTPAAKNAGRAGGDPKKPYPLAITHGFLGNLSQSMNLSFT